LKFASASTSAAIFHMFFDTRDPKYVKANSLTEGSAANPATKAPKLSVPATTGSREAADMANCRLLKG